jgi:hypothetical protein
MPYIFAASLYALVYHSQRRGRGAALVAVLLAATACSFQFGALLGNDKIVGGFGERPLRISDARRERYLALKALIQHIPPDASVAVTEEDGPHVSSRLVMYSMKITLGERPDYVLIGALTFPKEAEHIAMALRSGQYGLVASAADFLLLKRGADPRHNEEVALQLGIPL